MDALSVYAVDIGSPRRESFAWATYASSGWIVKTDPALLIARVVQEVGDGIPVALGFECPMFVPVPSSVNDLLTARKGEPRGSAFSASGGLGSLGVGLVEVPWIVRELRNSRPSIRFFVDWRRFDRSSKPDRVFLWEAFVTRDAHCPSKTSDAHGHDAKTAVKTFRRRHPNQLRSDIHEEGPLLSVVGAARLFAGAAKDHKVLEESCVVMISDRRDRSCRCTAPARHESL
jgi:hypothetical protein